MPRDNSFGLGVLPLDLWYQCMLLGLDKKDLGSLTLTCKTLRDHAQSILFRDLHFTGWRITENTSKKAKAITLGRIIGLQKSDLRKHTRHCTLVKWISGHTDSKIWEIGEALFNLLSSMPNLQRATCNNMLFKTDYFTRLCSGPNFRAITIRDCIFSYDSITSYRLEDVVLCEPAIMSQITIVNYAYAASGILLPDYLQRFSLEGSVAIQEIFSTLNVMAPFEKLTTLRITTAAPLRADAAVFGFLTRCPNLMDLDITALELDSCITFNKLPDNAAPRLVAFGGFPEVALAILPGRRVSSLTIRFGNTGLPPANVLNSMRLALLKLDVATQSRVKSVVVVISGKLNHWNIMDATLAIEEVFPNVQQVEVVSSNETT